MSISSTASLPGVTRLPVQKVRATDMLEASDEVTIEEPLEIRLVYGPAAQRREQNISVTMRTPGNDRELATGFLFTEGIIPHASVIQKVEQAFSGNTICLHLEEHLNLDLGKLQRHFYTSSSCGVCGKSSIDALRTVCPVIETTADWQIGPESVYALPARLRRQQAVFDSTGGLHASALFDREGNFLSLREDIGRHNALDKLIGHALDKGSLPLSGSILLLSGRACFELIQKAAMAGFRMVAAVGAPSSLAVSLAQEYDITLIGFLRDERFNVYTGAQRLKF